MPPDADSPSKVLSHSSPIRGIVILGAGTMGSEVAAQCAAFGVDVTLYDIDEKQLAAANDRLKTMLKEHAQRGMITRADGERALARVRFTNNAKEAAAGAELVSESVTENLKIKRELLAQFAAICPPETILTTNSSYFVPSMMAKSLPRPENFAAFHFHNPVWFANVVDIMPHPGTAPETIDRLRRFALSIGQTPIVELRENHGYVFNAMLRDFLTTAVSLAAKGIADVQDIDRAWMGVTKMPIGPFGMIDTIGLDTVHDIVSFWGAAAKDPQSRANAEWLKRVVEEGRLGAKSGHGFYTYPQPAYAQPDFLLQPGKPGEVPRQADPDLVSTPAATQTAQAELSSQNPVAEEPTASAPFSTISPTADTSTTAVSNTLISTDFARWTLAQTPGEALATKAGYLLGPVLIIGQGPVADACDKLLQEQSASVVRTPVFGSLQEALDFSEQLFSTQEIAHVLLLTGMETSAATTWNVNSVAQRNTQGLLIPYFVCRSWYRQRLERGLLNKSTLLAGVKLGGSMGLSPPVVAAEGGGIAGLLKAIHMEGIASGIIGSGAAGVFGPATRLVDFQGNESPSAVAQALFRELAAQVDELSQPLVDPEIAFRRHADLEVSYRRGARHHLRVISSPLNGKPDVTPEIHSGDVWVVTGGARGITSLVARALAEKYGIRLILLGTTPLPDVDYLALSEEALAEQKRNIMTSAYSTGEKPNVAWERVARGIEIQKSLAALRDAGVSAQYHACNVGDPVALAQVLERVRQECGEIRGVLHGAGVEITGRYDKKDLEQVERTLSPKFTGTLALMELTSRDPLRWFVAFGSLSGRFGGVGQTDYAMANDALAKLIGWFRVRRPECKSLCIHWPGWAEVGMAARPASRFSLERTGHSLLPPQEGVALILQEIAAGAPDGEVLFMPTAEIPSAARGDQST